MIKLKIKDKTYTIQEARELYNELKALFSEDTPVLPYYPPVNVPWVQPYDGTPLKPYFTVSASITDQPATNKEMPGWFAVDGPQEFDRVFNSGVSTKDRE